jgi:hypothetical protein
MIFDLFVFRGGTGGAGQKNTLELFHSFNSSLSKLGISNLPWFYYPIAFISYALAIFGARAFGFVLLKDVFRKNYFNLAVFFLLVFAVSGFFLSEVISIGYSGSQVNNAIWFSVQSLFGAWLLVSYFLMEKRKYQKRFITFIIIVLLFSVPSTIQFLSLRYHPSYCYFNSNAMEVISFLKNLPPESKVLHPLNNEPSPASNFAGRPSVINTFRAFVPFMIGEQSCSARISDVATFFSSDSFTNRTLILKKYNVDYVYAPTSYIPLLDSEPALTTVLKNNEYVVYRVQRISL